MTPPSNEELTRFILERVYQNRRRPKSCRPAEDLTHAWEALKVWADRKPDMWSVSLQYCPRDRAGAGDMTVNVQDEMMSGSPDSPARAICLAIWRYEKQAEGHAEVA